MKLLLDENLPHRMRSEISGHEVFTVAYLGSAGLENGKLLAAAAAGFDVLITNDCGLEYEQNQTSLPLAVIVLLTSANTIEAIRPLYPLLDAALAQPIARTLIKIGQVPNP